MIAVRFVAIWCDVPDCDEESPFEPTAKEARKVAYQGGWTRRAGLDFCPEHSEPKP